LNQHIFELEDQQQLKILDLNAQVEQVQMLEVLLAQFNVEMDSDIQQRLEMMEML